MGSVLQVPWFLPFLVSYSYLVQVTKKSRNLMQQLVAWRYLFQLVVYELAGATFVHKSLLLCGPARFSKNAPSVRKVGSSPRWMETQMPLKATVTLSLSPTHHCPKHIAWLNLTSYLSYRGWGKTGNKYLLNDEPNIQYHPFSKPRFQLSHWFYASHNILLVDSFFTEVNQHQLLRLKPKPVTDPQKEV